MKIFNLTNVNNRPLTKFSVCCLGWFDGLHRGHQTVIIRTKQIASKLQLKSSVFTLSTNNSSLFLKWKGHQIYQSWQKNKILAHMGVDYCFNLTMTKQQRKINKAKFLEFLKDNLNITTVVVGSDFRFGYQAKGTVDDLVSFFGAERVVVVPALQDGNSRQKMSSKVIRHYIQTKQIATAYQQLYEPIIWCGLVVSGRKQGRKIGIPTLNQKLPVSFCLPIGVYFSQVFIQQNWYPSLTCVWQPATDLVAETFVLDHEQLPPISMLKVKYLKFWREFIPLYDLKKIKTLILRDIDAAKTFFKMNGRQAEPAIKRPVR